MKNPTIKDVNLLYKLFTKHERTFKLKKDIETTKLILRTNIINRISNRNYKALRYKVYFGNNRYCSFYIMDRFYYISQDCLGSKGTNENKALGYRASCSNQIVKGKTLSNAIITLAAHFATRGTRW